MSAAAAEPMLEKELWVSFVSLLRGYVAAASLHSGESAEVEEAENSVAIRAGDASFEIRVNPQNGAGNWQLRNSHEGKMQGRFQLLAEGRIALDAKTLDLDHAAIDFAGALMAAAARREGR
ncbi:MAG: hypothetical protein WA294_11150 [Acidobacteriaceae bacterium]